MKEKPVIPRAVADRDVDEAISNYLEQGAVDAALSFVDALEKAYLHIGRHPASGSPRYAHELDLPDLRFWPVPGYPRRSREWTHLCSPKLTHWEFPLPV